jgi:hypothetical protein
MPICKQYHIHKNTFSEIGVYNFNFSTNNAEIGKIGSVNLQIVMLLEYSYSVNLFACISV